MKTIPFLLRDVPESLHITWSIMSKLRGLTMRAYLLLALEAQTERDKDRLGKELAKEAEEKKNDNNRNKNK